MAKIRQLLGASEEGDIATLNAVLDEGTDVNVCDSDDTTALQIASANGHEHIVRQLIMRGATLDLANSMGWTPLLLSARHGHVMVVSILLQNRADINAETKLGANALTLAARGGNLQICKVLIDSGIDLNPSTGIGTATCEFTALMAAAYNGHDAVVRYLIDHRFDVNYRTPSTGMNALMMAALHGHMATSQILIERGADTNLTNVHNATPLVIATQCKKRELKGYLERKTTNKPKQERQEVKPDVIEAAKKGDMNRLREILDQDLTQRDVACPQDGATPLMIVAMQGRLDIAQLLVEKGCDIDKQDVASGWTALMQAIYHGKKFVAKYLINAGANVLIPAKNKCTAFDMASIIDDIDTELYRLIAAKAVHLPGSASCATLDRRGSKSTLRSNGVVVASGAAMGQDSISEDQPKNGLKAWWNRFSARFRNLKGTMKTSNKLSPVPLTATIGDAGTSSEIDNNNETSAIISKPGTPSHQSSTRKSISSDALGTTNASAISTMKSYESLLLETHKTAPKFSLQKIIVQPRPDYSGGASGIVNEYCLSSVMPPFLPPATFEENRPKMPPVSNRRSMASLGSNSTLPPPGTVEPPTKLLQNYRHHSSSASISTASINASGTSPPSANPVNSSIAGTAAASNGSTPNSNGYNNTDNSSITADRNSAKNPSDDISPSSSGGASQLTSTSKKSQESKGPSSASSSTLTAGSGSRYIQVNPLPSGHKHTSPVSSVKPPSFLNAHHQQYFYKRSGPGLVRSSHSPGSSVSALSSVSSSKHSMAKSNSSKDTNSTLTPSSSPIKMTQVNGAFSSKSSTTNTSHPTTTSVTDSQATTKVSEQSNAAGDDLGSILKKLSLESYKPIFEEQEIDMEAFLTLTDQDLKDLGISHQQPRRQILTAVTELNSGKGRERQHLQETMGHYRKN